MYLPSFHCRSHDKALLLSLQYDHPERPPVKKLSTPHRDAGKLKEYLLKIGYLEANITLMRDDDPNPAMRPTRENVLREIDEFMRDIRPHDRRVFFFAGHGYQLKTKDPKEEDGKDEAILLHDHHGEPLDEHGKLLDSQYTRRHHPAHPDKKKLEGIICDNELRERLVDRLRPGSRLVAIFDTCHSGTLLDLEYYWRYWSSGHRKSRYVTMPAIKPMHSNSGGFWFIKQFPTPKSLRVKSSPTKYKIVDRIEKDPLDNEVMKRCDSPTTEEPTEPLYFEPAQAEVVSIASTEDSQRAWGKDETTTTILLAILQETEHGSLTYGELMLRLQTKAFKLRLQALAEKQTPSWIASAQNAIKRVQAPQLGSMSRFTFHRKLSL